MWHRFKMKTLHSGQTLTRAASSRPGKAACGRAGVAIRQLANAEPWMQRRAGILLRICKALDRRVSRGGKVEPAVREFSRRWNGRRLPGGYRLRLSEARLKAIFYQWRRRRSAEIFGLRYGNSQRRKVTAALSNRFLQVCCKGPATSFLGVYRTMTRGKKKAASFDSFHRSLSPVERRALRVVFKARADARRAELACNRVLEGRAR